MPRSTPPPVRQPARLSQEQMKAAIPKLSRRIEELKAVDVNAIQQRDDTRISALEQKIDDTLMELFGPESLEYKRYGDISLDTASINFIHGTPLHEIRDGFRRGIERTVSKLETIIELFNEKLKEGAESPSVRAVRTFADLDLHPEIARAASALFRNGHYANAVEDACKALDALVKLRSGRLDLSGTDLMQNVFSANSPTLKFNELRTESERSEQKGMMFLYSGAMLALRNPRAHDLIKDDPEQAFEYIGFLSMLAKSLDRATKHVEP